MAATEPFAAALAVLIIPLRHGGEPAGPHPWHRWYEAHGKDCGLDAADRAGFRAPPFKHYPDRGGQSPYFNPHVRRLLFPSAGEEQIGERWVSCPDLDLVLSESPAKGEPIELLARVDLVERLVLRGSSNCDFGIVHLTLEPGAESEQVRWWARTIQLLYRPSESRPRIVLAGGDGEEALVGRRPQQALAEALLGEPHPELDRHVYSAVMAPYPDDCSSREQRAEWRRQLAGQGPIGEEADLVIEEDRNRTARLGRASAFVRESRSGFAVDAPLSVPLARNLRSYWSESLLAGLVQHDALEHFQARLADLDDPLQPEVVALYGDWLSFRNRLWWSQLSNSTRVPQELLFRLRDARGTDRLFAELEGDLATYSAQQRSIAEGKQARALANLQVFGTAIVVPSALFAMYSLFDSHGLVLALLIVLAILAGLAAAGLVRHRLRERSP
jgi:hypothetical protein